ncbi:MAG: hypothetical protein HY852_12900 [Bradyrhizobium sp.]|uniref:hypothetical protein n=1 Tax=Bradyrhizobium sp. TaxID=376 RepID=UPI0025BD9003|nr:hypothetical protein [Bradyrhizobium sp.]MBI5262702.1 hypothetical protein [Bradyrhizobium sp.]
MIGITLTSDQIRNAPAPVRQWIEQQVISSLGLAAQSASAPPPQAAHLVACSEEEATKVLARIQGVLPAVHVYFEFGRPGVSYGQPPVMAFRLIDILHHASLDNVGEVMECLDMINQAFAKVRNDPSARFCGFDNEGHCLIAPETQQSIAALWRSMIASQRAAGGSPFAPAA